MKRMRREDYYKRMWKYEKKLKALRERFGYVKGRNNHPTRLEYSILAEGILRHIDRCKRGMKMIDKKNLFIRNTKNDVQAFIGISVERSHLNRSKEARLARNIFYKYCLENRINGDLLSKYVGAKCRDTARLNRQGFTKSFKTTPGNKEIYHRFLRFLENKSLEIAA